MKRVDEARYTERQVVEAQREAFARGAGFRSVESGHGLSSTQLAGYRAEARARYPLYEEILRTHKDRANIEYRWNVTFDELEWRYDEDEEWRRQGLGGIERYPFPTPDRIKLWADLMTRPTERVKVDE